SQRALLQLIHEKELREARDQNPLTKMKGNLQVNEYLQETLSDPLHEGLYVYFDFDYFKPYNDTYGFRQGDRVILLFADLLREYERLEGWFVGHIGGDDFFAGIPLTESLEESLKKIRNLRVKFSQDASAFYAPEDRARGYLRAKDRNGKFRKFPLLGVSAAIIGVHSSSRQKNLNRVSKLLGILKKKAKESPDGIAFLWLPEDTPSTGSGNRENETIEDLLGELTIPDPSAIYFLA
ncbi:MAG: diguanylate cyclase, partial [Spirochaetes bacterium]|nr:diguanylate cyclase [Spirochaetota bacterium]